MAFALQALITVVWPLQHGLELGSAIVPPLLTALVYAFVAADAQERSAGAAWERLLERAWAVIVIDFVLNLLFAVGYTQAASAQVLDVVIGIAVLGFSALLVFADASATVDDDANVWLLIPRSLTRSVAVAWHPGVLARALAIFSLWLLLAALEPVLYFAFQHVALSHPDFWAQVPLNTIATPPLAALTVLVYRDASGAPAATPPERE